MRAKGWIGTVVVLMLLAGCDLGTEPDGRIARVSISPDGGSLEALQDTLRLSATAYDRDDRVVAGVATEWASLDPDVATVDGEGRVVARNPGEARITASAGAAADTVAVGVAGGASTALLRFIALAAAAPELVTYDTTFWAVKGDDREVEIRTVGPESERFLDFEVPGDALLRYPDGRPFEEDDSVLIHLTVDPERFIFHFEPSGLEFDPEHPAQLELRYRDADSEDLEREEEFALWKQETPASAWFRIATVSVEDLDEVRAEITSFTAFSLATR